MFDILHGSGSQDKIKHLIDLHQVWNFQTKYGNMIDSLTPNLLNHNILRPSCLKHLERRVRVVAEWANTLITTPTSLVGVLDWVLAILLPTWISANVLEKAANDGQSTWVFSIHMRGLNEVWAPVLAWSSHSHFGPLGKWTNRWTNGRFLCFYLSLFVALLFR